jgi:IS30 family transposase
MDANHQKILDNLDEKAPRSRLGPYRDLILELRRRNRTYREILQVLEDRCQIRVSISTLYDFLHCQHRMDSKRGKQKIKVKKASCPEEQLPERVKSAEKIPVMSDIQQRIAALRRRQIQPRPNAPCFNYDPDQPLQLIPQEEKSGDQD